MIRARDNWLWWALAALAVLVMSRKTTAAASASSTATDDGTILLNGRVLLPPGLWRTEDWRTWKQIGAAQ